MTLGFDVFSHTPRHEHLTCCAAVQNLQYNKTIRCTASRRRVRHNLWCHAGPQVTRRLPAACTATNKYILLKLLCIKLQIKLSRWLFDYLDPLLGGLLSFFCVDLIPSPLAYTVSLAAYVNAASYVGIARDDLLHT
jgi:hypothetical protein